MGKQNGSGSLGSTSLIRDSRGKAYGSQAGLTDEQVYKQNLAGHVFRDADGDPDRMKSRQARIQAEGILSGTGEGMARTAFKEFFKNPFGGGLMDAAEIVSGKRKADEAAVLLDVNSDVIANTAAEQNRKKQLALGISLMRDPGLMRFFQ